jgi:hypothetical protein
MSCCGNVPTVYIDGKWSCTECGAIILKDETDSFDYFSITPKSFSLGKECECGADKTYGKGNGMHSATMPCPLYKKP